MGKLNWFEYLTPEELAWIVKHPFESDPHKKAKNIWARYTLEEKDSRAKKSIQSKEALRKRQELFENMSEDDRKKWVNQSFQKPEVQARRSEIIQKVWDSYTPEQRSERVGRMVPDKETSVRRGKGLSRYIEGLSEKEKQQRMRNSCLSEKAIEANKKIYRGDKISEALKVWWSQFSKEEKLEIMRKGINSDEAMLKSSLSCHKSPSMPEFFVGLWVERNHPKEWAYTGDGKSLALLRSGGYRGLKRPDFFNINGKEAVMEILGGLGYWHTEEEEGKKIKYYRKHGFDCLVLFEEDCYDYNRLEEKYNAKFGVEK